MAKSNGKGLALKLIVAVALVAVVAVAVVGSQGGWFQGKLIGGRYSAIQQGTQDYGIRDLGGVQQMNRLGYRIIQPSYGDLAVRDKNAKLLQVRLDNDTLGAVKIREFHFLFTGDSIGNLKVGSPYALPGGVSIQKKAKYQDGAWWDRATFTFAKPYSITKGDAKVFDLLGDVIGKSGSEVSFTFEKIITDENVSLFQTLPFTPVARDIQ